MRTGAELRGVLPQANECLGPQEAGRGKEGFSSRTFRGSTALLIPCLRCMASRTAREYSSVFVSHLLGASLSRTHRK